MLCIFHKGEMIAEHEIRGASRLNYDQGHYSEALLMRHFASQDEIEEKAKDNLARLREIGL